MNEKLTQLRQQYLQAKKAGDTKLMEEIEAIGKAIKNNAKCYQCKTAVAEFNGYYCSMECQNQYYPIRGGRPTIEEMQRSIIENARQKHIKTAKIPEKVSVNNTVIPLDN